MQTSEQRVTLEGLSTSPSSPESNSAALSLDSLKPPGLACSVCVGTDNDATNDSSRRGQSLTVFSVRDVEVLWFSEFSSMTDTVRAAIPLQQLPHVPVASQ